MTQNDGAPVPADAELVAYLDGELSPADSVRIGQQIATDPRLAARLDHLMKGGRPFRDAFAPVLKDAPVARLAAALDAALATPARPTLRLSRAQRAWAIAAALMLVVAGAGADRAAMQWHASELARTEAADDWRHAVAQYLALYTPETLAALPDLDSTGWGDLVRLGKSLGLELTNGRIELSDLALKRADLYDYDGNALAFLAYLDPKSGPVALCITTSDDDDHAPKLEREGGMNAVTWAKGGRGFMLIGRADGRKLQALADSVAARIIVATAPG